jgi:flagellin-like hook-associated protein FlgL
MSAQIALTPGVRTSLFAINDLDSQIAVSNKRLATGKRVNDVLDDPLNYFLGQAFTRQQQDLAGLVDNQNIGLKTLEKVVKTIDSITKLVESIQALARQARQSPDATVRTTLGTQIGAMLGQIDEFTEDAGFNGRNLLRAIPQTLQVDFNTVIGNGLTRLVVPGVNLRGNSADIGLSTAAMGVTYTAPGAPEDPGTYAISSAVGSWEVNAAGDARIDAFLAQSQLALNNLAARASTFSVNVTILQVRLDYSKAWQRNLAEATDAITIADMNEEGAKLTSLQTRQQMAVTALSLATRSDQAILRLFN